MKVDKKHIKILHDIKLEYYSISGHTFVTKNGEYGIEPNHRELKSVNVHPYRAKITKTGAFGKSSSTTTEGIIIDTDLPKLKNGIFCNAPYYRVVNQKFLDVVRSSNWESLHNHIYKKPFSAIKNGRGILIQDYLSYCHMVFDTNGVPYPVGIHFDYIDGNMDNAHYDLKKAFKILSKRKDIHNLTDIMSVPYYNSERYHDKCISFTWSPSREDYLKMWNACKEEKQSRYITTMEKHKVIFDLDMLGLRKGGAAYGKTYYDNNIKEM